MSEPVESPTESSPNETAMTQPRRARWQVGIRTLVLVIATFAVWMTVLLNRRHVAMLESRIAAMRPLAHELLVEDEKKIAVVKLAEKWMDENQWDLHLPAREYRLCIATRGIDSEGFPPVEKSAPLKSGRQRLVLVQGRDQSGHHISVARDGTPIVTVDEPIGWNPGMGSEGGGQFSTIEQLAADKPVVLYRKRFMQPKGIRVSQTPAGRILGGSSQTPTGPTEGIMVWIEPQPRP